MFKLEGELVAGDEGTEATASAAATGANQVRSKKGVARTGLKTVDEQAQKIWNVARKTEVAEVQIARAVTGKPDAVASGGRWLSRIALLRLYRVVTKTRDGYFKLTDLGIALANVGDDSGHRAALGAAVMGIPANAVLLKRYDGGQLPSVDTLATEFEFGYSMSNADAKSAAQVLIDSANYAGLVDDSDNVNLTGTVTVAEADDETDASEDDEFEDDTPGSGVEGGGDSGIESSAPQIHQEPQQALQNPPPAPPVLALGSSPAALSVKLDMSGWAVEDVLRVLAALGYEGPSRESET